MNFVKKTGKQILCVILEHQVKLLRRKRSFTIVAVAGSVGKTSTKLAVAKILSSQKRVRYQEGNYNDRLTVPLVIFGHNNPALFNIFAWIKIIVSNRMQIAGSFPYDIVVLELGTDGPGQIMEFEYLHPELAVVTAATPEHMEFFGTVAAVAEEELDVAHFSSSTIVNTDDVPAEPLKFIGEYISYGTSGELDYKVLSSGASASGQHVSIRTKTRTFDGSIGLLGKQGAKVALAAFAVASELQLDLDKTIEELAKLRAFSGRMNILNGLQKSLIIDDTYNASPAAVTAALDVLYGFEAPQRIAILGMMNELGDTSEESHREIGRYCNAKELDLVITIGKDARDFTAPEAEKKGCTVASFDSPYEAGEYAKKHLKEGAIILAKGSQNRVFAEESLKTLLADKRDYAKLVRQTPYWLKIKQQQFPEGQ